VAETAQNRAHTASQIADMTDKIGRAAASLNQRAAINVLAPEAAAYAAEKRSGKGKDAAAVVEGGIAAGDASGKAEETALAKAVRDRYARAGASRLPRICRSFAQHQAIVRMLARSHEPAPQDHGLQRGR
jgi:hypothetical protein